MATVFDFAARIQARLGRVDTFRLNKLVYYVQAWSLVHRDRPAFGERIEAWVNGPVARALWVEMRHQDGRALANAAPLSAEDEEIVEQVLFHYGQMSAEELIRLTHDEEPWRLARGSLSPTESSAATISVESMRAYYARVWKEAREDNDEAAASPAFVGSIDALERSLGA